MSKEYNISKLNTYEWRLICGFDSVVRDLPAWKNPNSTPHELLKNMDWRDNFTNLILYQYQLSSSGKVIPREIRNLDISTNTGILQEMRDRAA